MKSPQKAAEMSGIEIKLIRAVVRALGDRSYLEDVYNHGAEGGFPGFTMSIDCEKFWRAHRIEITSLVKRLADDLGENPAQLVAGFACLKIKPEDFEDMRDVYLALGNGTPDSSRIIDALAWFALEEVARAMCEED
jgi:hypothetical protein